MALFLVQNPLDAVTQNLSACLGSAEGMPAMVTGERCPTVAENSAEREGQGQGRQTSIHASREARVGRESGGRGSLGQAWGGKITIVDAAEASSRPCDEPLLILAGPGSGKTNAFAHRVAHLLAIGVPPCNILGFTFTRSAAVEMRSRVQKVAGSGAAQTRMMTIHSFALKVCRTYGGGSFQIFGRQQCQDVLAECLVEHSTRKEANSADRLSDRDAKVQAKHLLALFGRYKARRGGMDELLLSDTCGVASIYRLFEGRMKRYSAVDFTDIIINATALLSKPEAQRHLSQCHVLIDEFQDVSHIQFELLRALAGSHQRITAVGDDDQNIYAFAGAEQGVCQRFLDTWSGSACVQLGKNYRSQPRIVEACSRLIESNRARLRKKLWSDLPGGERVRVTECRNAACEVAALAQRIKSRREEGCTWGSMAVLVRTRNLVSEIKGELVKAGVPCREGAGAGGLGFDDDSDGGASLILSWLRLATCEADDASCARVLRDPLLALRQESLHAIRERARTQRSSMWAACRSMLSAGCALFAGQGAECLPPHRLPEGEEKRLRAAARLLGDLQSKGRGGACAPEELVVAVVYRSFAPGQGVVRKPVGGGGNGYGGKKQRNGNEGKGESSGTAGIGADIKLLPHSVRSLVYAARNYEFEVLGVQTGKRKAEAEESTTPSSSTPDTTSKRHATVVSSPAAKGYAVCASSPGGACTPSPSCTPSRSAWGSMSKGARKTHTDSMRSRVMKSSQGKKMSTTSTSGNSSRSSSSVGMMGAPATPSQTAQATVETSATLVPEPSPTEGSHGRSCLRLATFLEWLAVAEVEGHCAFSGGGGPLGDKVVVTTLHQSKGLEWDDVYVCRVNEGILPLEHRGRDDEDAEEACEAHMQEERRLLYVGMSRARHHLTITYPIADSTNQQALDPSRFLGDIGYGQVDKEWHEEAAS